MMTDASQGGTIAATFTDKSSAEACLADLKASEFTSPWLAVTPSTAAGRPEHAIAESSDGPLGRFGRFLSGAHSLRQALIEHGVGADEAERIDASLALGGAVIVVDPGDRADLVTEIFRRGASRVLAPGRDIGGRYPSTTEPSLAKPMNWIAEAATALRAAASGRSNRSRRQSTLKDPVR